MPQGKQANADVQIPEGFADVLFDNATNLKDRYDEIVKARGASRDSLRALEAQGLLSDEEREMLAELYPERSGVRRTPEERAEALRKEAEEIERKAKADAAKS